MAKRKRLGNYEKKIAEGRCQGEGADYKPYINNQDIASQGRTTRHKGINNVLKPIDIDGQAIQKEGISLINRRG